MTDQYGVNVTLEQKLTKSIKRVLDEISKKTKGNVIIKKLVINVNYASGGGATINVNSD
jgi:hypothetical protein